MKVEFKSVEETGWFEDYIRITDFAERAVYIEHAKVIELIERLMAIAALHKPANVPTQPSRLWRHSEDYAIQIVISHRGTTLTGQHIIAFDVLADAEQHLKKLVEIADHV